MELFQIISFSVKIFALAAAVIVLSSYLVFKMKDRKRKKPYAKISADPVIKEPAQLRQITNEQFENIGMVNAPEVGFQYDNEVNDNTMYENTGYDYQEYENEPYEDQKIYSYQNQRPRNLGQRFKVLNDEYNSAPVRMPSIEKLQVVPAAVPNTTAQNQARIFNIYDYYSNNNYERMHKIKF